MVFMFSSPPATGSMFRVGVVEMSVFFCDDHFRNYRCCQALLIFVENLYNRHSSIYG